MATTLSPAALLPSLPPSSHRGVAPRRRCSKAGIAPLFGWSSLLAQRGLRNDLCSPRNLGLSRCRYLHLPRNVTSKVLCSQVKVEDDIEDEACELVNGAEVVIGDDENSIRAYLLKAVKNNNGAGVLLLSDIFGFEDSSTREFAYRVACNGYNVLVPDLFRGNPWKKDRPWVEFDQWLSEQHTERVARDIDISAKWLIDEFAAAGISMKLGIIGFCLGGRLLVESLARDEDGYYASGICFYGTRLNPDLGSRINIPVLFVGGDDDPLCPVSTLEELAKNIQGSKVVIYDGRGHGFAHRPESQEDDQAAEDAFSNTRNWLHDGLLGSKY